jgi:parallel beta-helix repeat protein
MVSGVGILGVGTVSNFTVGFRAQNSSDSFVKSVTVTAQCPSFSDGFDVLAPGGGWTLQKNVVREPGISSSGIFLFGVDNNNLVGNDVNDSMSIVDSSKNTIINNTASDNFGGIFVVGFHSVSQNNQIHANTTNNNTLSFGLDLGLGATNNNITGNKSFGNDPFDMQDDNANCGGNKWEGNHFNTANQSCIK